MKQASRRIGARVGVLFPLVGLFLLTRCGAPEPKRIAVETDSGAGATAGAEGGAAAGRTSGVGAGNATGSGSTSSGSPNSASPSGGSTGSGGGSVPLALAGEACSGSGASACVGPSQKQRFVCLDGIWAQDTPCSAAQNCDQLTGECIAISADCVGRSVGFRFCDPSGAVGVCGLDLVRVEIEECDGTCSNGRCTPLGCGDGVVTAPEECDDGNTSDTDDCTSECKSAGCGDGILQTGEECDDGNTSNTDSCAECKMGRCGDTFVQVGEDCDDGNTVDADGCTNKCQLPGCGDNVLQTGEDCDDGNTLDNDMCTNGCKRPRCGDRIIQMGEACDDGNAVNDDACSNSCTVPGCPDDIKQMSEECDDGNMNNTDDCTSACKLPKCGDSFTQESDECDDGNMVNDDGCTNACKRPKCGDNITQRPTEECDDGNTNDLDGCSNSCKPKRCGDNVTQEGEECDDGNTNNTDGCTAMCKNPRCNDGIVSSGENCEDGNTNNGDGCSSTCQREAVCGDGMKATAEECDDGNRTDADLCRNSCKNTPSLQGVNASCNSANLLTQTLCNDAAKAWCGLFGQNPTVAMVTGTSGSNFKVGCLSGLSTIEVTADSAMQSACQGGQQQSPRCRSAGLDACEAELGDSMKVGVYLSASGSKMSFACGPGNGTQRGDNANLAGCGSIAGNLTAPVPVECENSLTSKCGNRAGVFARFDDSNDRWYYTCVAQSLSGVARRN